MPVNSAFVTFVSLFVLVSLTFGRGTKRYPHSARQKLARKSRFSGSKRDLNKPIRTPDYNPSQGQKEESLEDLKEHLGILEVLPNGDQFLTQRNMNDILDLLEEYKTHKRRNYRSRKGRRQGLDLGPSNEITGEPTSGVASYVGRVTISTGGRCSGILIRSNIVLTAAHCLHEGNGGDWFDGVEFFPRLTSTHSSSGITWSRMMTFVGWTQDNDRLCGERKYDIGLIELANSANLGNVGWGYDNGISVDDNLDILGYKGNTLLSHTSGTVSHTFTETLFSDDTSIYGGMSGGPVYFNNIVRAVQSADDDNVCSWGRVNIHCRITSWKFDAFRDWIDN